MSRGRVRWGWFGAALVLMLAYELALTQAWGLLPLPHLGETWNWTGKLTAVALTLAVAALPATGWRRAGLTLRQDPAGLRGALALSAVLVLVFLGLALALPGEGADAETLAFQLTLPGLDEELFYRGVLLLMLNEAFGQPLRVLGARLGWGAALSCLAFGLVHALGHEAGAWSFEPMVMAATGGPAILLVWLREKTGSVLLPVLLHNWANSIFLLV